MEVLKRYQKCGFHLKKLLRLLDQAHDLEVLDHGPPAVQEDQRQVQRRLGTDERLAMIQLYVDGATTVGLARQFGVHKDTVRASVDAAGVRRRPKRHLTQADAAQACLLYEAGASMRSIGRRYGVSPDRIKRHLTRAGVRPRRG